MRLAYRISVKAGMAVFAMYLCTIAHAIELRTVAQDSAPKYYLENGKMAGLCVDIMNAMQKLDPGLKFVGHERFQPISRIQDDLEHGRIDVFCGMIRTIVREAMFTFVDIPLYWTETRLAVRKSDPIAYMSLDGLKKLEQGTLVLVVHGTAHVDFLRQHGVTDLDTGARTTADNIKKLLAGRGRFIYQTDLALAHEMRINNLYEKMRVLPGSLHTEAQYFSVSKSLHWGVTTRIKAALQTLHANGELERLRSAYLRLE